MELEEKKQTGGKTIIVIIVGPCHPSYGSLGDDRNEHEIEVEIEIQEEGASILSDRFIYGLRVCKPLDFPNSAAYPIYGVRHGHLIYASPQLKKEAGRLDRLDRYLRGLPVQPETLDEVLATILSFEKARVLKHLTVFDDHHSRASLSEDAVSPARACYILERRLQGLGIRKQAAS